MLKTSTRAIIIMEIIMIMNANFMKHFFLTKFYNKWYRQNDFN